MSLFGFIKVMIPCRFLEWWQKELTRFFVVLEIHSIQFLLSLFSWWLTIKEDKWQISFLNGLINGISTLNHRLETLKTITMLFLILEQNRFRIFSLDMKIFSRTHKKHLRKSFVSFWSLNRLMGLTFKEELEK